MKLEHQADRSGKLLSFLRRELRLSSTLVNRLKVQNAMFVNGVHVYTNHMVIPGDIVSVIIEEPTPEYPAEPYPLSILYVPPVVNISSEDIELSSLLLAMIVTSSVICVSNTDISALC